MSNVIKLNDYRNSKCDHQESDVDPNYLAKIKAMDKLELLEEMVRFQENRVRVGGLDVTMIVRGRHLFKELANISETPELKILTLNYLKHLDCELEAIKKV